MQFISQPRDPPMTDVSNFIPRPDYQHIEPNERDTSAHSEALFNRIPNLRPASDTESHKILIPTDYDQTMKEQLSPDNDGSGDSYSPLQEGCQSEKRGYKRKEFSPETRSKRDIQNRRKVPHDVNDQISMWSELMENEQQVETSMSPHQIVDTLYTLFSNLREPNGQIVPTTSKVSKKKAKTNKESGAPIFATPLPKTVNMEHCQEECKELKQSIELFNHLNNDVFQNIGQAEEQELSSYIIFSQEQ